jgi:Xaa-Pro aminopeptidase
MTSPFAQRRQRLRKLLRLPRHSVLLVTNLINVGYLTGFTGSAGWLLVGADHELFLSDGRYETQLAQECPDVTCEIRSTSETLLQALARVVKGSKYSLLRYEAESLSKASFDQLAAALENVELKNTENEIESLRAVKDAGEIATIRRAIRIAERTIQVIKNQLLPFQTESELAHELEHQMRRFGASGVAFSPSVAVGHRAALPHGKPSNLQLGSAPFLLIDWGAKFEGYASDLTRILVTGKIPAKFRKIYDTVLAAQNAAIAAIHPGATYREIDAAARAMIENAGFGKYFNHGTGHGLGLEIHETPFLSQIWEGKLVAGMVVTIEPGIYLPSFGGVRIEDDVLVTQNGHEVLSSLPRDLDASIVDWS